MYNEEVLFSILDFFSKNKKGTLNQLIDDIPYEKKILGSHLNVLYSLDILTKKSDLIEITSSISPFQITKMVDIGLGLKDIEVFFNLSKTQKQQALNLASEEKKLKKMEDDLKAKKQQKRAVNDIELPRDVVVETLERLAKASENSIEKIIGPEYSKQERDEILKALTEAKKEALNALEKYQKELSKGKGHFNDIINASNE